MKRTMLLALAMVVLLGACDNTNTAKLDNTTEAGSVPALDSINRLIKATPSEANLYFDRAKIYYDLRDLESSMNDVGRAMKLDSNNASFYLLLADLKLIQRESKESRDLLLKAHKKDPSNIPVLLKLGELYMIVQDADASFRYLNEALKLDVYNATAYRLKGFNYKYLGDTTNAVSSFQTAVEQDPNDYDAYLQLGLLYSSIAHPLALDYYNNALKVRPRSVEALYAKGLHLQTVGKSRDAISTYHEILEITDQQYFDAWYNIGYVYLVQLESFDSASVFFTEAIKNGPTRYEEAYYNRGLCYEKSGKLALAETDYREALRLNPQYDLAALGLGRIVDTK